MENYRLPDNGDVPAVTYPRRKFQRAILVGVQKSKIHALYPDYLTPVARVVQKVGPAALILAQVFVMLGPARLVAIWDHL